MAADGRRTVSDGREAAFGGRSADRQRRRKKKHLIEAAPFGHLDQMLRMGCSREWSGGALPPQPKTWGSGEQRPPAKICFLVKFFSKNFEQKKIRKQLVP